MSAATTAITMAEARPANMLNSVSPAVAERLLSGLRAGR